MRHFHPSEHDTPEYPVIASESCSIGGLRLRLIAVAIFCTAGITSAATYYVSPAGSDSNRGSESSPFRHLSRAVAKAKNPGDVVMVMDGTYDNEGEVWPNYVVTLQHSGTAQSPITIRAQNRGRAILDSMNTSPGTDCNGAASYFNLRNAAYVVIQGFIIQHACDSGFQSNDSAHDITIRWNEVRYIANRTVRDQIGRDGIYLNNHEYNFTFDGNIFHDIGRTDGQANLHFDHGIYARAQNLTIVNNVFYNMNRGFSIQLANDASRILIANNTFAFGNANGEDGQIIFWQDNSDIAIQNNIFYKPNGSALNRFSANIAGSSFDHNLIFGANKVMSGSTSGLAVSANLTGENPMFVDPAAPAYDFRLRPGSPAIGAGVPIHAVHEDADGHARAASRFDLGAYASGSEGEDRKAEGSNPRTSSAHEH